MGPTQERLKEVLRYEPETGVFVWAVTNSRRASAGSIAGCTATQNRGKRYRVLRVDGKLLRAARLAHLYMTGEWPVDEIDHINGDGLDDRWCNLRQATRAQNNANTGIPAHNTSGFKGVSFDKKSGLYEAYISVDNKKQALGRHATPELAHAAYVVAAERLRGAFARME